MLSPSDFNDAVPQFTNGSYANDPLNPLFIEEPGTVDYNRGVEPLQTLPAQWWNWFANKFTTKLNKLNIYVKNIFDELAQLLSLVGITPDATESELTVGQLKGMFQTNYPQYLYDNFKFESLLQGRTRGVMVAPTDTWDKDTSTLSLTGGFGIINAYHKVTFSDCDLVFPNNNNLYFIVSDSDGVISVEGSVGDNVILVGLYCNNEYCLLIDNNTNQCKDSIILKKWYAQYKTSVYKFVPALQTYYNTTTSSITTDITIDTITGGAGIGSGTFSDCTISVKEMSANYGSVIDTGTFNNCIISIDTINANYPSGINNGTFNNCDISIGTVSGNDSIGIRGGTFNNCNISIGTISASDTGITDGTFSNCTINIDSIICVDVNSNYRGISAGTFNNCIINIHTIDRGGALTNTNGIYGGTFNNCTINIYNSNSTYAIYNRPQAVFYLTYINCASVNDLSGTGGKLNILNGVVLHVS